MLGCRGDPDGDELTTDDDSAGSLNARISFYQLPSSGTYTIVVESFDSVGGSYTLSLGAAEINNIEYTQTVNGVLTEAESTAGYRFTGQEGVEAAWSVVQPILGLATPVHEYQPGTWGPSEAEKLTAGICGCDGTRR